MLLTVPSAHSGSYGQSWMCEAIKSHLVSDTMSHSPHQELSQYLLAPLEDIEYVAAWWGVSLFLNYAGYCLIGCGLLATINPVFRHVQDHKGLPCNPGLSCTFWAHILEKWYHSHTPLQLSCTGDIWCLVTTKECISSRTHLSHFTGWAFHPLCSLPHHFWVIHVVVENFLSILNKNWSVRGLNWFWTRTWPHWTVRNGLVLSSGCLTEPDHSSVLGLNDIGKNQMELDHGSISSIHLAMDSACPSLPSWHP